MKSNRNRIARLLVLASATALVAGRSAQAAGTTYTWANSNVTGATPPATLNWFSATQGTWTGGTPVSSNANTIQFFQDATTALANTGASGNTQTSNIDNGGAAFQLGTLTLQGKASATTGANLTMTISGDALNFSAATSTINLSAVNNTRTLNYNLNSNLQLGTASSADALTITGIGSGTFAIGGNISELQTGGGSLIKSGTSAVTLSGTNSFTGGLSINAGTVSVGSIGNQNASSSNIGGAYSTINIGSTSTGGTLTYTGAGETTDRVINLAGTTGGATLVNSGTGALVFSSNLTTTGAGAKLLALGGTSVATFINTLQGTIGDNSGATSVTKSNVATWALTNTNNSFTGAVEVDQGTLQVSTISNHGINSSIGAGTAINFNGSSAGAGTLKITGAGGTTDRTITIVNNGTNGGIIDSSGSAATIFNGAVTTTNASTTGGNFTLTGGNTGLNEIHGVISNSPDTTKVMSVTKSSTGSWIFSGANTYTGTTTISGGTLTLSGSGTLGATTAPLTMSGGTLDLGGGSQTVGAVSITVAAASGNTIQNGSLTGVSYAASNTTGTAIVAVPLLVNGSAGLTKSGAGTLNLWGVNTYTGTTTINASGGILQLGDGTTDHDGVISNSSNISDGATLAYNIFSTTYPAYSGTISGSGAITKSGPGTLALSGTNTSYTGATTLSAGTLQIYTASNLNTSALKLAGGTLDLRNNVGTTFGNNVTMTGNATINVDQGLIPSGSAQTHTLGTLAFDGTNSYTLTVNNNSSNGDGLAFGAVTNPNTATATFTVNAPLTLASFINSNTGAVTINGSSTTTITGAFNAASSVTITNNAGLLTIGSVNYTNAAGKAIIFGGSGNTTVSGNIVQSSGTLGITKSGNGTTILNGTSSATGSVSISGGVLQLGNTGALNASNSDLVTLSSTGTLRLAGNSVTIGALTMASTNTIENANSNPATLTVNQSTSTSPAGVFQDGTGGGALSLALIGGGTLGLTSNTFTGGLYVKNGYVTGANNANAFGAGTIYLGDSGGTANAKFGPLNTGGSGWSFANPINVVAGSSGNTLSINAGGNNSTFSGAITLANNLSLVGTGGGNSMTFTGGITGTGNLILTTLSPTDKGTVTLSTNALNFVGTITNNGIGNGVSGVGAPVNTISSNIGASVLGLSQNSATTKLVLKGTNTFTAATNIASSATLQLGDGATGNDGSLASTSIVNNGTLAYNLFSPSYPVYSGVISGTGAVTQSGAGTLTLTGPNSYTGVTTLTSGTLSIAASNNIGGGAAGNNLVFSGGTLQVTGTSLNAISGLTSGGRTVTFTATKTVGLDINNSGNTFTVDQVLNQTSGGFIKLGAGTAILNQVNTYTGGTTVSAGTLELAAAGALPANKALTVAASAKVVVDSSTGLVELSSLNLDPASTGNPVGKIDLNNNALVDHTAADYTAIYNAVKAGSNNLAWDGTVGITSTTAATDSSVNGRKALGVILNDDGTSTKVKTSLGTLGTLALTDVLVNLTYYGDANLSGTVDGADYTRIDAGYNNPALKGWFNGDFNYDGTVDGSDYSLIDGSFGAALTALPASMIAAPAASVAGPVAVPEPTTLGLIALGATTLLSRRTRRSK